MIPIIALILQLYGISQSSSVTKYSTYNVRFSVRDAKRNSECCGWNSPPIKITFQWQLLLHFTIIVTFQGNVPHPQNEPSASPIIIFGK